MLKNRTLWIIIFICILIPVFIYYLNYKGKDTAKIIDIKPSKVSIIKIFNGDTGKSINVNTNEDIKKIISNLNSINFIKDKSSYGYMGSGFSIFIYDDKEKEYKSIAIHGPETIIYDSFFYKDPSNSIDFDFIKSLFKKYNNIEFKSK